MTPLEIFKDYQNHLDLENDTWSDPETIWRNLYQAQNEIIRLIAKVAPSHFVRSTTITLIAGQDLYDLPLNARLGTKIVLTEDIDDEEEIEKTVWDSFLDFQLGGLLSLISGEHRYSLERDKIRVVPTPEAADTFRVWYVPVFGNMLYGAPTAATATTLTGWTDDPNFTTTYGVIDKRPDYYNGMSLEIISGSGVGEVHEVTDYSGGATPVFTVAGFTATPDTDSIFALQCPVPEDFHDIVPIRAAMKGAVKQRNRLSDMRSLWREARSEMLAWVPNRQAEFVEPDYTQGVH